MAGKPKSADDAVRGAELAAAWALVHEEAQRVGERIAFYDRWPTRPGNAERERAALVDERARLLTDAWRGRSTAEGVLRARSAMFDRARRLHVWGEARRDITYPDLAERTATAVRALGVPGPHGASVRAELVEALAATGGDRGTGANVTADAISAERLGLHEGKTVQRARRDARDGAPSIATMVHVAALDRLAEMPSRDPGSAPATAVDGQSCPPDPASTQPSPVSAPAASVAERRPSKRSNALPMPLSPSSASPSSKRRASGKRSK